LLPMQPVKKVAMTDQHCCPCRSTNSIRYFQNKNKNTHPQLGLPAAHFHFKRRQL
jgi:hypothetical protein